MPRKYLHRSTPRYTDLAASSSILVHRRIAAAHLASSVIASNRPCQSYLGLPSFVAVTFERPPQQSSVTNQAGRRPYQFDRAPEQHQSAVHHLLVEASPPAERRPQVKPQLVQLPVLLPLVAVQRQATLIVRVAARQVVTLRSRSYLNFLYMKDTNLIIFEI